MVRRQPHEAIELDQSLRRSRAIWLTLALVVVPIAVGGLLYVYFGLVMLIDGSGEFDRSLASAVWNILIGVVIVASDIFLFKQSAECSRRLRALHEDPTADVKPLLAPFQASLLGPYH